MALTPISSTRVFSTSKLRLIETGICIRVGFVSEISVILINLHLPKSLALTGAVFSVALVSCVPSSQRIPAKATRVMSQWYDDQGPGAISLSIDLGDQHVKVMRGNREIGWAYVATGIEGRGTPAGTYHISEKIVALRNRIIRSDAGAIRECLEEPGTFFDIRGHFWDGSGRLKKINLWFVLFLNSARKPDETTHAV